MVPDLGWRLDLNTSIVDGGLNNQGSLDDYDCAVCGETLPTLASLQAHLLARHCSQSDTVLRLLRGMQEQIEEIMTSQSSLVSEVKIVKNNMRSSQGVPAPAPPTAPPAPTTAASPAPIQAQALPPAAPSYAAAAATGQQAGTQAARKPGKISFVTDSIGDNIIITELEKITKTKIRKRKAYGAHQCHRALRQAADAARVI